MSGAPGVTVCPDCGTDLEMDSIGGDKPIQTCTRACPDCSYTTDVAVLWFPDETYSVIGTATDKVECDSTDCSSHTDVVSISILTRVPRRRCPDHRGAHIDEALLSV